MGLMSFFVRLGLDATQFKSGLMTAQSAGQKFARDVRRDVGSALAGIFAVDKIAQYGKETIDLAGKLTDLSSKLGVSAEFLQEVGHAAEMAGAGIDDVSASLEKLSISRSKALSGDAGMVESFKKLGITFEDLKQLRVEDLFSKIGSAFEGGINPQQLIGPLKEIAGKGAGALIPAMADGLAQAAENARQLNLILSNETVAALDDVGDRMTVMNQTLTAGVANLLGKVIQPAFRYLEALGSSVGTFLTTALNPSANKETSPLKRLQFLGSQTMQAFRSSLEEQDQSAIDVAAGRKRQAELRNRTNIDQSVTDPTEKAKRVSGRLTASSDPLARIGGFTAFGVAQDRAARELVMQTRILRNIERATVATAKEMANP